MNMILTVQWMFVSKHCVCATKSLPMQEKSNRYDKTSDNTRKVCVNWISLYQWQ